MPIVIKELFASDPLSEALEKINFNFDQMILAGGGPPGPAGPQGVPGVPGPQGDRGDHWQVGVIPPITDHGPGFGSLLQNDLWTSSTGQIYAWNAIIYDWDDTSVNIMGPAGATGVTGGSYEWRLYYGATSNYRTSTYSGGSLVPNNWLPFGNSQIIDNPNVNFITPVGGGKNALLLGDIEWAKFNLNNFLGWNGGAPGTFPNQTPKLTLIQNSIDFVGFGGLAIGAYGMTSATGSNTTTFSGGLTNYPAGLAGPTGDARNMFFAGLAIKSETINSLSVLSHVFRARTNTIDLELQAGDINTNLSDGKNPSIRLSNSNSTIFRGVVPANESAAGTSDLIRSVIGPTYSRYRDPLMVGFATADLPTLQNIITADAVDRFIVNGGARIHGDLLVGDRSATFNRLYIGINRLVDGPSEINFYTGAGNGGLFQVKRFSGVNGLAQIANTGTGSMFIDNSASNIRFITSSSNGYVSFLNNAAVETARFDTVNNRLGIGTTIPGSPLHVNGPLGTSQATIATFSNKLNSSYTTIGAAGISSSVNEWTNGSNILEFVPFSTGNGIISAYSGSLKFQTSSITTSRQDRMTISPDGNIGIGTITPVGSTNNTLQINNLSTATGASANIAFTNSLAGAGYYLRNRVYSGNDPNFELVYSSTTYANAGTVLPIISVKKNGAVGIGTTEPSSSLHVKGIIKSDIGLSGGIVVLNNPDTIINTGQILGSQIFTGVAYQGNNPIGFNGANITVKSASPINLINNFTAVDLDIQTIDNTGTLSSRIFVSGSDGNVGIGTTSPTEKLHVSGIIKADVGLQHGQCINVSATNLDLLITSGFYEGSDMINSPGVSSDWWYIQVDKHSNGNQYWVKQEVTTFGTYSEHDSTFTRTKVNNVWRPWNKVVKERSGNTTINSNFNVNNGSINLNGAYESINIASNYYGINCTSPIGGGGALVLSKGGQSRIRCADTDIRFDAPLRVSPGSDIFFADGSSGLQTWKFDVNYPSGLTIKGQYGFSAINISGNSITFVMPTFGTSDKRLKTEISRIEKGTSLDKILKITGALYTWNNLTGNYSDTVYLGLYAQEIQEAIPEAISRMKSERFEDELSIQWNAITTTLIGAVKDQNDIIISQEKRIKELEDKLSKIDELLNKHNII